MVINASAGGKTGVWCERVLDLLPLLKRRSHFLFGPRQTGKTFLVRRTLAGLPWKQNVGDRDLGGLRALKQPGMLQQYLVVSLKTTVRRKEDGVLILPWREFLDRLWAGELD